MMKPVMSSALSRPSRNRAVLLAASTAVAVLMPLAAMAEDQWIDGCKLVDGVLPPDCAHANAGSVVEIPAGANTETDAPVGDLGPYGFAITIEAATPDQTRRAGVAGADQLQSEMRRVDRMLDAAGVSVTYDGLGVRPRLAVATDDLRSTAVAGQTVTFRASSNYPAWVDRAEVRILDASNPAKVLAVVQVNPNGSVAWAMPTEGPDQMLYALRVYDSAGRYDETRKVALTRTAKPAEGAELDGRVIAAGEGEDMTARRGIPVRGGAVTVSGDTSSGGTVTVMGESAIADASGAFVIQRILPPGVHEVRVGVGATTVDRQIEVPQREWFYVGLIDLTYGQDKDGTSYQLGRIAGYAKGHTADGYTITVSADTREGPLEDILTDLDAKNPDRILRDIQSGDVYPTFGDDSTMVEGAPTSGKLFLRIEKDQSSMQWGDFKASEGASRLIRSDRTLYGLQALHASNDQTTFGEPKVSFSAYGAQPDRLVQRDVLRGTGGSAYFLKRQDILEGTETIYVQYRDPVSGNVVRSEQLVLGTDYEIDYFQGVILLKHPLSASAGGALVTDRPLGEYDVNLVAQYEYVPTTGSVDGVSVGGRAEAWVTDTLRVGVSGARETTGIADNKIVGADVLLRHSDTTYLSVDYARSEGPGFGTDFSVNGGLDIDTGTTAGAVGMPADAVHMEGKADLAELTAGALNGSVSAYVDRKEAGFVSSDYDIDTTQRSWGLQADIALSTRTKLMFGIANFADDAGEKRRDLSLSGEYAMNDQWTVSLGIADTDRSDPSGSAADNGQRTDLGAKLTWKRDEDLSVWVFGQATLRQTGGLPQNDRLGVGAQIRLTDRLSFEGEVSDGNLGTAGSAELIWDNRSGTSYHMGYRLDPLRSAEDGSFAGSDGGTWVLGADAKVSDTVTYVAENTYDLKGEQTSLTTAYGVRYTPSDKWSHQANLEFGQSDSSANESVTRRAIGAGFAYSDEDRLQAGLKGEFRRETSTDGLQDRDTWLASGYATYKTSDDWRLLLNLDALVSDSDQSSFRDGRYVEANLGYAYRPVENDGLNALMRYTYLYDLPGEDQVNVDGDLNGPKQKSHILSLDVNYDLSPRWTLGAKFGYRTGEVADRGTDTFIKSSADLTILRVDYHLVHNWDLMAEGRLMNFHETDTRESGALVAAYRHFGNNLKIGLGYQWGGVSDDLRSIDGSEEGVFLNIVGKF